VSREVGSDELLFHVRRAFNAAELCPSICLAQLHREAGLLYAVELDRRLTCGNPPPVPWRTAFQRAVML
jgi:hypothetical protein